MALQPAHPANRLASNAFRNHAAELHRYLIRRVGHAQDADDLAQEVFARLLRIKDADLVRKPLAYLLGIATHVLREFRQRKQHEHVLYDSELAESACDQPFELHHRGHAEQLELQNQLDRALARLPATHRLVLLLVKRDGMSYPEAAIAAGLSVHTIEKYVVESRARMRVLLKDT
jgi:RNA polymerase sigma factor (sigma-70 family)